MKLITPAARKRLAIVGIIALLLALVVAWGIAMPGRSHRGALPPLGEKEAALREALERDVGMLATRIGERSTARPEGLAAAADFIEAELRAAGLSPERQACDVGTIPCANVEAEVPGGARKEEIVVVGAHYDSLVGTKGANDNGTGTAAVLSLARAFAGSSPARTLRFVLFVNEEPPHFFTDAMGSRVYAKRCRERGESVAAMLSLETLGFYRDTAGSQRYPHPILSLVYPSEGNFAAFVGNLASRGLVRETIRTFRETTPFPSEGIATFEAVPGIGWSDHWSFWKEGYPAVMVTDTAPFRYPHYHTIEDTAEKIDSERLARVVGGIGKVVEALANPR